MTTIATMTPFALVVGVVAAIGGVLFGFDIGVVGGVEAMKEFQYKFFPEIYDRTVAGEGDVNPYCVYNNHQLQLFSSSMFLSGAIMAIPAGHITRACGRKITMIGAASLFLLGSGLQAGAVDIAMLVCGRIVLGLGVGESWLGVGDAVMLVMGRIVVGLGVGAANQVVPLYIGEAAPYRSRGALTALFQLSVTAGILVAQLVNYGNQWVPWGWRLSLGLAGLPAMLLLVGGILLPESPNSLIE
ncbi:hypothetical protein N2152v2_000292, partial [Parachlorella kessleri]